MKIALCEERKKVEGILVRTIGLENLEGYRCIRWVGGVDVLLNNQEELEKFLNKYGNYV